MNFVTVGTYVSLIEAQIVKGRLESEGIPAIIADGMSAGVMPFVGSSSGVHVQVGEENAAKAKEILSDVG
jgi:hypothetical protein